MQRQHPDDRDHTRLRIEGGDEGRREREDHGQREVNDEHDAEDLPQKVLVDVAFLDDGGAEAELGECREKHDKDHRHRKQAVIRG